MKVSVGIKAKNGKGVDYNNTKHTLLFLDGIMGVSVETDVVTFRTRYTGEKMESGFIIKDEIEWAFVEFDGLGKKSINWIKKEENKEDIKNSDEEELENE